MNYQTRKRIHEDTLSELELEIATYIMAHPKKVSEMKIISLAQLFFTVPNTISRLCHKLGYSGFLEMKKELAFDLNPDIQNNRVKTLLLRNLEMIDSQKLMRVAKTFDQTKAVNVFAVGSTAHVAKIMVDHFNAVSYKFTFYEYEHEMLQKIKNSKEEVFFFISLSGEKEPLLSFSELLNEREQKLITLTALEKNTLSENATMSLYCYSPLRMVKGANITDKLPLLIMIESLLEEYLKLDVSRRYE
ncbi:MurR/RpiR family transcriptional regulator [Lactococcus garvieae]|uniref:MurR/RpiR family transcriptional regulator n=1 Tax=Lactococcus garvieae TaxID=1363 RepID=UPI0038518397